MGRRWIVFGALLLAAAAVAGAWPGPAAAAPGVQVFFTKGERLAPVARAGSAAPLGKALRALLAGPTSAERAGGLRTSIPRGTRLRGVSIRAGVATIDLTSRFGSGGGTLSMHARLAQVVYTATQFRTVSAVRIALGGRLAATLGGEGVVIDRPLTRQRFAGRGFGT